MKLTRTKQYHFAWLGVIPMLDVVFIFVFLLLLSSNFVLQPGISVTLPVSRFKLAPQINPDILSITGGATPAIYFRDEKITLEQLGAMFEQLRGQPRPLIIKADRTTPYSLVVAVTNSALEHGVTNVSLAMAAAK